MTIQDIAFSVALCKDERREAVAYIEAVMRKSFGCEPPPTQGIVCIARIQGEIVGSLVLQDSIDDAPFPVEHHYEFDAQKTPFAFSRDRIMQASRWTATRPGVSLGILRYAFSLAYGFGKRYVLIEAKPYSVKRLTELGIVGKEIEHTKLLKDRVLHEVGQEGMKYYLTHPTPSLYMITLSESI